MAHQPLSLSRAASASPQLAAGNSLMLPDDLLSVQPFIYNTLPRTDKRSNYWGLQPQPPCPSVIYSTTDPHFLSAVTTEEASTSSAMAAAVDHQDSSWSSDHLYCNMASVDPLPSLPPRVSRRCHSLLALDSKSNCEDADYENLQPAESVQHRLNNASHSRSRSLRHSGDFAPCWLPGFVQQEKQHNVSSRRQQLMMERANRLELMLNDASTNDYSDTYEPSDWSMEAMLSDTVRDLDSVSLTAEECHHQHHHCCCPPIRRAPCCPHAAWRIHENAATQTEASVSPAAARAVQHHQQRASAAENPLYMAYNDLTKIDDYEDPAVVKAARQADYTSDGCETWNSHQALYARLQASKNKQQPESPKKRRKGRHRSRNQQPITPSSSRIWRHEGQSVSTPQKGRKAPVSANTTLDRTALSTRSSKSQQHGGVLRRRKSRKPKAADVLHGKGQLQLAIYLNSGLLTIHGNLASLL